MSVTLMNERDIEFMLYELFDSESLIQRERYQDHDRHTFNEVINTAKVIATKHFLPIRQKLDTIRPPLIELVLEFETLYKKSENLCW